MGRGTTGKTTKAGGTMRYKDYRMKGGRLTLTYSRPDESDSAVNINGVWYDPNGEVMELPHRVYYGTDNELESLVDTYRSWFIKNYPHA